MFPHLNIAKALHLFCTVFGFWNIALLSRQKLRQRFSTAATAATYMRPRWGLWRGITAMLFAPPPLMALRTLRALNLGKNVRYCVWRSRIADRNNAPRSVSRASTSFRDDCEVGERPTSSVGCHFVLFLFFLCVQYLEPAECEEWQKRNLESYQCSEVGGGNTYT